MNIKHCIVVFVVLIGILNAFPSFADTANILNELDNEEWNFIGVKENVKFGGKTWSGANDVSFKYKIKEKQGIVYILVDVKDDKVILKNSETILSDHVEIWLADSSMVRDQLTQIDKLRNGEKGEHNFGINNFNRRLKEKNESSKEQIKEALADLYAIEKEYRDRRYYIQVIFNKSSVFSSPKNTNIQNIYYGYKTTSNGYEFLASIPLSGLCDLKDNTISSLYFLIDVVDIDDATTEKQKTLLSTSSKRILFRPETFNTLQFKQSYSLPISVIDEIKMKLEPDGYFRLDNSRYVYVTQRKYHYEGSYGADRHAFPSSYEPLEIKDISKQKEFQVFSFDSKLAFKEKDKYTIFDLKSNTDYSDVYVGASGEFIYKILFQDRKNNHYYLLLDVQGASRWPPGAYGCGFGVEKNIVWMELDEKLAVKSIQSVLYESCNTLIENNKYLLTDNSIELEISDSLRHTKKTTTYNNRTPEMGLITEPK